MLKGLLSMNGSASSALFTKPTSGSSSMIQAIVVARLGNIYAIQNMYSSP